MRTRFLFLPVFVATWLCAGLSRADEPELRNVDEPKPNPPRAEENKPDKPEPDRASLNAIRGLLSGAYFRGTQLVGYGSRLPYQGAIGSIEIEGARFLGPVGLEGAIRFGLAAMSAAAPPHAFELALDVAPLRWRGQYPGAFALGAGGGIEFGKESRLAETVRAYPQMLARARLWPTKTVSLHGLYRLIPLTTNELAVMTHRAELGVGIGLLTFGARLDLAQEKGGDPSRIYRETKGGVFIGIGFYP